jgi:hypothetical protein
LLVVSGLLSIVFVGAFAGAESATGSCAMAGVDSAPWTNFVYAWACTSAGSGSGWGCDGVSLVWACHGGNASGATKVGVWTPFFTEEVVLPVLP